ncbi:MAG TPA: WcaF family extracellular polysaccharide biosynthesis acetyltransferase [Acidobacteriaceae bacterium]
MSDVRLRDYDNRWYHPGRSLAWQVAWFLLGLPVLRSGILPSSALRVAMLRLFGARIGTGVVIKQRVNIKYPWHLAVGDDTWIGEDCWIDNLTLVSIGSNACLSQGSYVCTGNHDWSDPHFGLKVAAVHLEEGAWLGAKAMLLPGVTMGRCSVATAGSVVTRSLPAYEIHSGNPARFVKKREIAEASPAALPEGVAR